LKTTFNDRASETRARGENMTTKHDDDHDGLMCANCAPPPDPDAQQHPLPWYVGRYVKQAFRSGDAIEHMWVWITAVNGLHLTGLLANHPRFVDDVWEFRDKVDVWPHDIELVDPA
jgi:hypothetical protein